MVPDIVNAGLVAVYLLLLAFVAVRYRRGSLSRERLPLMVGMCLVWLSYGVLQLSQEGPIPTGTRLNYALDGLAVVMLVAGLYLFYRWWAGSGSDDGETASAGQ